MHFIHVLLITLTIFAYYAGLCSMLLPPYNAQNYAGIIGSSLTEAIAWCHDAYQALIVIGANRQLTWNLGRIVTNNTI